jgi:hypothetical protein
MVSIKDKIIARNRYNPTRTMKRRALRSSDGAMTIKRIGDLLFDERGGCFEVTQEGTVPYTK